MARFERIRSVLGEDAPQRPPTYPDVDDFRPPEEIANPHLLVDETAPSLTERALQYRWWLLSASLLAVVTLGILTIYLGRFFATTFMNPWVQRAIAAFAVAGAAYWVGNSRGLGALVNRDWLVLYNPGQRSGRVFLLDEVDTSGRAPIVVPLKGVRHAGHTAAPYRAGELSEALVTKFNRDTRTKARLRLHPGVAAEVTTPIGRVFVQETAGIEPDPFGKGSNIEATLPDQAATETVVELKEQLEDMETELDEKEDRITMLERQREDLLEEARKTRSEVRAEIKDDTEIVLPFVRGSRATSSNSENGTADSDGELDAMRRELAEQEGRQ